VTEIQDDINAKHDVDIDVLDALLALEEHGLVYAVDGTVIGDDNSVSFSKGIKIITSILFSKTAIGVYCLCMLFLLSNFFFWYKPIVKSIVIIEGRPGLSLMLFFVISWFVTLWHELGHYLAAVNLGVYPKLRLSLRFCFLVAETDINGIWALPMQERDICYLAGILFESVLGCACIYVLANNMILANICEVIILVISMNYLWQLIISMRTDLYLIILNHLNIGSLHSISIKNFRKLLKEKENVMEKYQYVYIAFFLAGLVFSVVYTVYNAVIYYSLIEDVATNYKNGTVYYWDTFLLISFFGLGIYLWICGFKNRMEGE